MAKLTSQRDEFDAALRDFEVAEERLAEELDDDYDAADDGDPIWPQSGCGRWWRWLESEK